eukprot:2427202-Alexandrium_andersonii.AAC.1
MSASLVGSEMCIRDRFRSGRGVLIVCAGVCRTPRARVLSRENTPFLRLQWSIASSRRTVVRRP